MLKIDSEMLKTIADLHEIPSGAYNIRKNGSAMGRRSTEHIEIIPKEDKPGIDIRIAPNTKNESVHIPVILSESGMTDVVYNDFYIGENQECIYLSGLRIPKSGQ